MPTPTPTTLASLASLPGWTIDTGPADYADARWTGHGVTIAITYEADTEDWDIRFGERGQMTLSHEYDATEADAVAFALSLVAIVTAATNTLAAAALPPPPTTIAELAARPGWRLDDGDAIHDGAKIIASTNRVDLGLGDVVGCLDEQEAAEIAFAVAPITARAQARYAAASAEEEKRVKAARQQKDQRRIDRFNAAKSALQALMPERREMRPGHAREVLAELHRAAYPDGGDVPRWLEKLVAAHIGKE